MRDYKDMDYNKSQEDLVKILMSKTQNSDPMFFRVLVSYYFAKVASMMWCNIKTKDRGSIPVSLYALNLASSGLGKGYSTSIIEEQVLHVFKDNFIQNTFPQLAEVNLAKLSVTRAAKNATDPADELIKITKAFEGTGPLLFSFDSATTPAVKEMRNKLLMANAGSMNLEIDEIGNNLLGNSDAFGTFLELFDVGRVKQKLIKNTKDNQRIEEIDGRTPTNLMMYGTPDKLFDGGRIEEELNSMFSTGYARRCFFGYTKEESKMVDLTPDEVYDLQTDKSSSAFLLQFSDKLGQLANANNFNKELMISKDVTLLLLEYKLACMKEARSYGAHEETRKAEMEHRYFKALKLAGAYAFIETSAFITEDHLYQAIKLTEDSGDSFKQILTRERPYIKLANYIATVGREVTQADLVEDLPFYKGSDAQKREMMTLAIAHGYKNNIIIKKKYTDEIEFLSGESLEVTDLDKLIISFSKDIATGYLDKQLGWKDMAKLVGTPGYHWVNHHLINGHRKEENCKQGFNLITLDIDSGTSLQAAKFLLDDYKFISYTTKRHQTVEDGKQHGDRFRIVIPINYTLKMDPTTYKEFMNNVFDWLPFEVDRQTNQRARKWMSHAGTIEYHDTTSSGDDAQVLDILDFIPETKKAEVRKTILRDQTSLNNLERWFVKKTSSGNRSNQLIKYALALVDAGQPIDQIQTAVLGLNDKLPEKLPEVEVMKTIMKTVGTAIQNRQP